MVLRNRSLTLLSEMVNNQRGVFFASLLEREERKTKDGKPYFRALFRDANRQVNAVLWEDSPFFAECRDTWTIGTLYKIDAILDGDLDEIIDALTLQEQTEKLKNLNS